MGVNGIYGLSGSGLDIESMVKVGMMSKQNEYDKMYKQQTKATWQKEAYTEVYNSINNFNNSKLTDYKLQSKMNAMTASSNNTTAFTVTANGSAAPMSHKVEVKALSSNAYLMSTEAIGRKSGADKDSINLKDSMFQSITDKGDGTFSVTDWDGKTKTVKGSDAALSFVINDGKSDSADSARTVTMTYEEIAGNKSFNDLASAVNKLNLNITASYDSVNDTFSLYNKNGGAENSIDITVNNQDTANLFKNLKLGESKNGELTPLDSTASAPEAITGTEQSFDGSKSVAELLGLNIGDIEVYDGKEMYEVADSGLEKGVKRYRAANGEGDDLLVKTEPETATIDGNTVTKVGDEDGYTRYKKDDNTDILVKSALAGGTTKYFTMEVATGKDSTTGKWSDKGETNPVTVVTPTKYSTQEVAQGTAAVEENWSDASETSPFTSGQYINGQLGTLVEGVDDGEGVQRYRLADGSGKDILVKTEEVETGEYEKNITINGVSVREVQDSSLESGVKRYTPLTGSGGDILVKTASAQTNQFEKFIAGNKVNLENYDTATGISRYTKEDGSGEVLVKATANGTDEDGNTIYSYQTKTVGTGEDADTIEWSPATDTDPVYNGNRISKTMYQTMEVAYGAAASTGTWSEATETNPVTEEDGDPIKKTQYRTKMESDEGWSEPSDKNPVTSERYISVNGEKKSGSDKGFSVTIDDGNGEKSFSFTYASLKTLTIDDVVNTINGMNTNLKASFTDGKFTLENTKAGAGHEVFLRVNDELSANFFKALGIGDGTKGYSKENKGSGKTFNVGETMKTSGTNGEIVVDGRSYTNITDNRATIGGVTYTLLDKTESAAVVTVSQDQDAIIDRVKQFVEDYNTMLKELQDKYTETKYSDYGVLTKSQEDAMTKEQVEKWNDKAKSGLLYHDKYIGDIISKMREALSTPVEGVSGKYNSAFNIGIRTNTDQGRIELDEDKLKQALTAEPNSVYEIFGKMG
ncbi:MAG: flagellar filament capping protein FliD, partial [Selenomonadaceae bacterium]|nr:flagellar filament capping protein FliD [Selenomonadaceae bacterium]